MTQIATVRAGAGVVGFRFGESHEIFAVHQFLADLLHFGEGFLLGKLLLAGLQPRIRLRRRKRTFAGRSASLRMR